MSKKFDLDAYKKTIKVSDTPLKEDRYIELDNCLKEVLGLPGIPMGHITQVYGKSDSGKTSLLFHTASKTQTQGVLPILIVTEGKVDWNRAKLMGFDRDKAIIEENISTLEEGFEFVLARLADQANGNLPQDIMIFWDSIGNTVSKDEFAEDKDGNREIKATMMKAAKVISNYMRHISPKINDTRKISYPSTAGLMFINQAYMQPPQFVGGPSSLVPYGGAAIWYRSSLVIKTSKVTKLTSKKDGKTLGFGIVSKIQVDKNHISNTSNSGEFVITADNIMPNEKGAIAEYKDIHKESWGTLTLTTEDGEVVDE